MEQYVNALIYTGLGFFGLCCHWFKKRFKDKTTLCSLKEYLMGDIGSTVSSVTTIILAEIPLSLGQSGSFIGLTELIGAITAGYALDSGLNRAPDKLLMESINVESAIVAGIYPTQPDYPAK